MVDISFSLNPHDRLKILGREGYQVGTLVVEAGGRLHVLSSGPSPEDAEVCHP